ncbi:MAG: tetratricopeptide repeat protein [Pseudomonadota bacterium]
MPTGPARNTGPARYGTANGAGADAGARQWPAGALEQLAQGHQLSLARAFDAAEACFRDVIVLAPDWPMAHNNLAWIWQAQGRNEEAVAGYNRALQLDPALELAQANLAFLLANLYFFLGKFADAHAMWRFLAGLYPEDAQVLDKLVGTALRLNALAEAGQWAARHAALTRGSNYHALLGNAAVAPPVPMPAPALTRGKLQHDLEQYRHLRGQGLLGGEFDAIIDAHADALTRLDASGGAGTGTAAHDALYAVAEIRNSYGRIVHHYPAPAIAGSAVAPSDALLRAESEYLLSKLGIVVIDDFLAPAALAELQKFCRESTVWHSNSYSYDRLGAFFRDGFNCPLLLQIAEEIQRVFPNVIGEKHPLLQMWGYKYRHDQPATHPHADFAAVNVNFWITPDDAKLDGESGGLVIYDVEAPLAWEFDAYNRQGDRIAAFLKASGAASIVIPYRCNRAIIFNSDLFHATAPLAFRPGYLNQRVNITMLYGEREAGRTA